MKIQLIVVQGKPEGKVIPMTVPVFRIGRGPDCHLRPNSEQVSREHAEIAVNNDQVTLRDLGSRNGSLLNGKSLSGVSPLKNGDVVQIGPLTFAVSIQGAPAGGVAEPVRPGDSSEDVTSWLVADAAHATPESPSGIYGGDTMTLQAYKGAVAADSKPPSTPEAKTAPAKPPSSPAVKVAPAPTPVPAPAAVSMPLPAPVPAAVSAPAAVSTPVPVPAAVSAPAAKAAPSINSHWDNLEFEALPEGEGDAPQESYDDGSSGDADNEDGTAEGDIADELLDPTNPFYVAKNKLKEEEKAAKPSYKDSSDAAADVLRKLMDRRRASKG